MIWLIAIVLVVIIGAAILLYTKKKPLKKPEKWDISCPQKTIFDSGTTWTYINGAFTSTGLVNKPNVSALTGTLSNDTLILEYKAVDQSQKGTSSDILVTYKENPHCTGLWREEAGTCVCPKTVCTGQCVDTDIDNQNCGTCGNKCPPGTICCKGKCVSTDTDNQNCGACGIGCTIGTMCCKRRCINATTSTDNCGSCGNVCKDRQQCVNGTCSYTSASACNNRGKPNEYGICKCNPGFFGNDCSGSCDSSHYVSGDKCCLKFDLNSCPMWVDDHNLLYYFVSSGTPYLYQPDNNVYIFIGYVGDRWRVSRISSTNSLSGNIVEYPYLCSYCNLYYDDAVSSYIVKDNGNNYINKLRPYNAPCECSPGSCFPGIPRASAYTSNPIDSQQALKDLNGCSGSSDGYLYILFTSGFTNASNYGLNLVKGQNAIGCSTAASLFINDWRGMAGVAGYNMAGTLLTTSTWKTEIIANFYVTNIFTGKSNYIRVYHSSHNYNISVSTIPSIDYDDYGSPDYSNFKAFPATSSSTPAVVIVGPPL